MARGYHNSSTPLEERDELRTPPFVFAWASRRFRFVVDLAATHENALCDSFCTKDCSALGRPWAKTFTGTGWCNPPYSDIDPWLEQAHQEAIQGFTTVFLIPSPNGEDRWGDLVFERASHVIDIVGRISFLKPDGTPRGSNNRGSCFVVFSPLRTGAVSRGWVYRDAMKREANLHEWSRDGL